MANSIATKTRLPNALPFPAIPRNAPTTTARSVPAAYTDGRSQASTTRRPVRTTVVMAGAFLGMAGNGRAFGSIVFVAALFATQGFLRYGWPRVQRFHERREPDERDPTSMRFQGFSADVRVFLTLFVAVALVVAGLVLLELSLA